MFYHPARAKRHKTYSNFIKHLHPFCQNPAMILLPVKDIASQNEFYYNLIQFYAPLNRSKSICFEKRKAKI